MVKELVMYLMFRSRPQKIIIQNIVPLFAISLTLTNPVQSSLKKKKIELDFFLFQLNANIQDIICVYFILFPFFFGPISCSSDSLRTKNKKHKWAKNIDNNRLLTAENDQLSCLRSKV